MSFGARTTLMEEARRGAMRLQTAVAGAWNRVAASDPGLERLFSAARTTVAVAAAVAIAELLVRFARAPITTEILAAVIAETASITVRDPEPRAQRITTLLLPLAAACTISLGSFLGPSRIGSDVGFLAIMFGAVAVRRFGPRLVALGTLAFFGYFFSIFLAAKVSQLPWSIAAIIIGTVCAFVLRFVIFPDRPDKIVRRALVTFHSRQRAVLVALAPALAALHWEAGPRRALRRKLDLLKECAIAIEDRLAPAQGGFRDAEKTTIRLTVFDAELSAENLAARTLATAALCHDKIPALQRAIEHVRATIPAAPGIERDSQQRLPTATLRELRDAAAAMDGVHVTQGPATQPLPPAPASTARVSPPRGRLGARAQRLAPATRQAIQVTLASTLALVAGELLSPRRWYWAVLAAFVVFSGTQSSGETRTRAWSRALGTALGVLAGLAVVVLVGNDHGVQLALVFAFMFGAMYFFRTVYGLMVFFITALLALLYKILGNFSTALLLTRLIETAVGSAIGVLVATFVLPTSTREALGTSIVAFLGRLATVIEDSGRRMTEPGDVPDPTVDARELDRALADLFARAQPATAAWPLPSSRSGVRHRLLIANACARYARNLARSARRPDTPLPEALARQFSAVANAVAANVRSLADEIAGKDGAPPSDIAARFDELDRVRDASDAPASAEVAAATQQLRHIHRALARLGRDEG